MPIRRIINFEPMTFNKYCDVKINCTCWPSTIFEKLYRQIQFLKCRKVGVCKVEHAIAWNEKYSTDKHARMSYYNNLWMLTLYRCTLRSFDNTFASFQMIKVYSKRLAVTFNRRSLLPLWDHRVLEKVHFLTSYPDTSEYNLDSHYQLLVVFNYCTIQSWLYNE